MVGGLTYLVDTNVWLELLLERANAESVREFLRQIPATSLKITEFTLYSIAILLTRLKRRDVLTRFLAETLGSTDIGRECLGIDDLRRAVEAGESLGLNFDDAYQYVAAEKDDSVIVSFDKDFDSTPRGRKSPAQVSVG